jgi:O-methyltransferase involved in polyketide biosynthesis
MVRGSIGHAIVLESGRMTKFRIEPGSVQETLIIPLYGRKLCAELFPKLYRDESAARICEGLDYDFSDLDRQAESTLWRFGALEAAMRQLDMQWEIDNYLAAHLHAAVVNMGCGLDQTGRACDNGTCKIYNVDMPDIIAAREALCPAGERELSIASNLNDFAWMDEIDGSGGAVFFAAGVFCYLTFDQAKALAAELARRFPGSRLVFDTMGKLGKKLMRQTFKNFGMENYDDCLYVENIAEVETWVPTARVSSRGYMLGYFDMDDPAVTGLHRFLARRCDGVVKMRIVHMDFADKPE